MASSLSFLVVSVLSMTAVVSSYPLGQQNFPLHYPAEHHPVERYPIDSSSTMTPVTNSGGISVLSDVLPSMSRMTEIPSKACINVYSGLVSTIKLEIKCLGPGDCDLVGCASETFTIGASAYMTKVTMKKGEKRVFSSVNRHTNLNICRFNDNKFSYSSI